MLVAVIAKNLCLSGKAVDVGSDPWQSDIYKPSAQQSTFSGVPPAGSHAAQTTSNPVANATPSWGDQSTMSAPNPAFAPAAAPSANPWGALQIDDTGSGASF